MNITLVLCTIDSTFRRNYFMSELKNQISQFIDTNAKIYQDISLAIHAKPEVSDFEYFASQTLSEQLKKEGFEIELPAAGHRTGFAATYKSNKPGPTVVFLVNFSRFLYIYTKNIPLCCHNGYFFMIHLMLVLFD